MLSIARQVHKETGSKNLCMAGGVALNCVGNGHILREGPFDNMWIQPAAGDAGGALGVALALWYRYLNNERTVAGDGRDAMQASLLGPAFSDAEIDVFLGGNEAVATLLQEAELPVRVAEVLAEGKVVGWARGRCEWGPRALGARSILADPRSAEMREMVNRSVKFR